MNACVRPAQYTGAGREPPLGQRKTRAYATRTAALPPVFALALPRGAARRAAANNPSSQDGRHRRQRSRRHSGGVAAHQLPAEGGAGP